MIKSLHIKLVIVLVLLIVSVMAVTGTFLINSVMAYQINEFKLQMTEVFTTDFIDTLIKNSETENAPDELKKVIEAYTASLGIDSNRNYYILSSSGKYLRGSNERLGNELEITPNIIKSMNGEVGDDVSFIGDYMDLAVPVISAFDSSENQEKEQYIIYIKDNRQRIRDLNWMLFVNTIQAMFCGLIVAVFLSFFLSKTMTIPIEDITKSAVLLAEGRFSETLPVYSEDELGELTKTFNNMAKELKETIAEVEGERDKLNTLFLHMADGVAAFTGDGALLHINPAAEEMLGISYADGLVFKHVLPGVDVKNIPDAGSQGFIECSYQKNEKQLKIFFATFRTSENESGLMAVIHDITEQSRLEENRREFVANVSHELRTPLTNVKSYTETLVASGDSIPEETRQSFLNVIMNEADRMTRIVSDLLTLSKFDYGKMALNCQNVSVYELLKKIYDAMVLTARKSGCNLLLIADENLPEIYVDKERIEQVVVNILSNAVKYTPEGGRITIESGMGKDNYLYISVTDTGIGIPKESLSKLFERFYRVDKARSRAQGGTGLGLSIAKEIVEIHKGKIFAESEVGKGTKFTVLLPIDNRGGESV